MNMESAMTIVRSGARDATPEETFKGVFARHYGPVYAYCARRIGRDDAADAASEVFTVAWRKIRRVPAEPETLPWLYGVARNVVRNQRRSRNRQRRLDAKAAAYAEPPVLLQHPDSIEPVLERLRDDDREILMLAAWEGLGPGDLGAALGCSANTAAVRLHRARARLSEAWDDINGGGR
jgi:RNA polymerase sigma-70 factor (ECF subfamily)